MKTSLITYSALNKFTSCRASFKYRYIQGITPKKKDENLVFGSLIHDCLEDWMTRRDRKSIKDLITKLCRNHENPLTQLKALAMMKGYIKKYPSEKFKVINLEKSFHGAIVDPETKAESEHLSIGGKIDGIVKTNDKYYIIEHKTASFVNDAYIKRLPIDFQILLYSIYAENIPPYKPISGVIYNILIKTKIKYGVRTQSLRDYYTKLCEKHCEPEKFRREFVPLNPVYIKKLKSNLWELSKEVVEACSKNIFYPNQSNCYKWNKPCEYYDLCYSTSKGHEKDLIESLYEHKKIHSELDESKHSYSQLSDLAKM